MSAGREQACQVTAEGSLLPGYRTLLAIFIRLHG
ncbi:hypothetical protein Pvag_pPag20001 (plasmid) [Pantoea vagans C9-1]|nr:hypothetical protein Pvag_pPag20001 [Pantoea vagans C9-1]